MSQTITVGAGQIDRILEDADSLLRAYRQEGDIGYEYIKYTSPLSSDQLIPEDLAVTLLVNSRAGYRAFQSIRDNASEIDLGTVPHIGLEDATDSDVEIVAQIISKVANWKGFGASMATKVLHKKRPALIPILDNQAIFGAYMNSAWPEKPSRQESVKAYTRIVEALQWIRYDLQRSDNQQAWETLRTIEPNHSRIELFDSIWWSYFRQKEPVKYAK